MRNSGLFVTGTDTGVGKTLLACAAIRALRHSGVNATGFKPAVSGSVNGRWPDVDALSEASGMIPEAPGPNAGSSALSESLKAVCPFRYHTARSPFAAARFEGSPVDFDAALRCFESLMALHDCVVAEGAGGILVPLNEQYLVLDFIKACGLPVLIAGRGSLGTVNHTLLTIRELERARVPIAGVVLNTLLPLAEDADLAADNGREITRLSGIPVQINPYIPPEAIQSPESVLAVGLRLGLHKLVNFN